MTRSTDDRWTREGASISAKALVIEFFPGCSKRLCQADRAMVAARPPQSAGPVRNPYVFNRKAFIGYTLGPDGDQTIFARLASGVSERSREPGGDGPIRGDCVFCPAPIHGRRYSEQDERRRQLPSFLTAVWR